jgi:hypothetical protein
VGSFGKTCEMDVVSALGTYLDIVDSTAPGLVEGLYVVGSFALDDWHPGRSDINIIAVMAEPATDEDFGALRTTHALLNERQSLPYINGPYLAWADLVVPPGTGLHRPWTLDGQLRHDGECIDINPVVWYMLAAYGVKVRGPSIDSLSVWHEVEERVRFVIDNLLGYWARLAPSIVAATEEPAAEFDLAIFEFCTLGPLRMHYTAFTGDVTSKQGAGEYGIVVTPDSMHETLRAALQARREGEGEVTASLMLGAADLISWTVNEVRRSRT